MRNRFEEQLFELNREIIEMGALCEEAISKTVEALTTGNTALAADVVSGSGAIDQMERSIESLCMKLLLHQQPVARDLRLISAAMKMITDMGASATRRRMWQKSSPFWGAAPWKTAV